METYPEHEKLKALDGDNDVIGRFLEWLQGDYVIAKWNDHKGGLFHAHVTIQDLLAEYFEIDPDKLEEEKNQMLAKIRG